MGSYGWYGRPPGSEPPSYPRAGPPSYHQLRQYGWPPPPPPRRPSDARVIALSVGLPLLAMVLIGVVVVVLARSNPPARTGLIGALTQAAAADASIERYWSRELPRETGTRFRPARLELFADESSSSCRRPPGELEAFYCPHDKTIFVSMRVYPVLANALIDERTTAFARMALLAHEYGHHVQFLTGEVRDSDATGNDVARLELQADCYAGLWAHAMWRSESTLVDPIGEPPRSGDIERTFALIGDLTVWDPRAPSAETEVHGSAAQREAWFMSGYVEGNLATCDTTENVGPDGFPLQDELAP